MIKSVRSRKVLLQIATSQTCRSRRVSGTRSNFLAGRHKIDTDEERTAGYPVVVRVGGIVVLCARFRHGLKADLFSGASASSAGNARAEHGTRNCCACQSDCVSTCCAGRDSTAGRSLGSGCGSNCYPGRDAHI